jgi:hypothetical protein
VAVRQQQKLVAAAWIRREQGEQRWEATGADRWHSHTVFVRSECPQALP